MSDEPGLHPLGYMLEYCGGPLDGQEFGLSGGAWVMGEIVGHAPGGYYVLELRDRKVGAYWYASQRYQP